MTLQRLLLATTALVAVLAGPGWTAAEAQPASQPAQAQRPPATGDAAAGMAQRDGDMAAVLQSLQALGARPIESLSPEQARRQPSPADAVMRVMRDRGIQQDAAAQAVETRNTDVQGAGGMLQARVYTPGNQQRQADGQPPPLIVYWHGGGWVIADLDTYDATPRALAAQTGAIVLSVHYRQAPENRFPAAHEDAVAAYRWAVQNAAQIGADPRRVAVAGESAGGNLAMNVAIAAREQNLQAPLHVLAIYPVAGSDMNTPSYRENAQAMPLSRAGMEWFVRHAFSDPQQARDPRINLVGRDDLRGLPPVTVITAQIDPLRSEGEMLAAQLRRQGVAAQHRNFDGVTHEFFGMATVVADARAAQQFAAQQLRGAFGTGGQGMAAAQPTATPGAADTGSSGAAGTAGAGAMLTLDRARALIGTNLVSANDRRAGEIDNFLLDGQGRIRAAIVEWGGFLGIGERRAIVPAEQIQFGQGNDRARLDLTREQLDALPRYERGQVPSGMRLMRE